MMKLKFSLKPGRFQYLIIQIREGNERRYYLSWSFKHPMILFGIERIEE